MQLPFRLFLVFVLISTVVGLSFLQSKPEPNVKEFAIALEWMRDEIDYCSASINEDQEQIKGATICHAKRTDKGIQVILEVNGHDIHEVHKKLTEYLDKTQYQILPVSNPHTLDILILL